MQRIEPGALDEINSRSFDNYGKIFNQLKITIGIRNIGPGYRVFHISTLAWLLLKESKFKNL